MVVVPVVRRTIVLMQGHPDSVATVAAGSVRLLVSADFSVTLWVKNLKTTPCERGGFFMVL